MTQPPPAPPPGEEPWHRPGGQQPPSGQEPYGGGPPGQGPPAGGPYGGMPEYAGSLGGYVDPAAGLASRWARLGAAVIDGVLLGIVSTVLALPFVDWDRVIHGPRDGGGHVTGGRFAVGFLAVLLSFLYHWLFVANRGQTLGKMVLGIRVVGAEDGGAVGYGRAAARAAFFTVLGNACGCVWLIDVLWLLWDRRKQTLHDKVTRTVVAKVDPTGPDPYRGH